MTLTDSTVEANGLYLTNEVKTDALSLKNSKLTVTGKVGANVSGSISLANNSTLTLTYTAANAAKGESDTDASDDGLGVYVLQGDSTSSLILTGYQAKDGSNKITLAGLNDLKKSFFSDNFAGSFGLEGATITDAGIENGEVGFEQAKQGDGLDNVYNDATVTGVTGDVSGVHNWGNAELANGDTVLSIATNSTIKLYGSGSLVTQSGSTEAAGVTLASGSTVGLNGTNASVGAITASGRGNGTVQSAGTVTVASIGSENAAVQAVKVLGNSALTLSGNVFTQNFDVAANGAVDMGNNNLNITATGDAASIAGTVTNVDTVISSGNVTVTGTLSADNFRFTDTASTLFVGADGTSASVNLGKVNLNGGTAIFDPSYDQQVDTHGILVDNQVSADNSDLDYYSINGNLAVGRNVILGIGAYGEEAKAAVAKYVTFDADGSLFADKIGAAVYQDTHYTVENGKGVLISAGEVTQSSPTITADTFTLGSNTAWVLSGDLVDDCTGSQTLSAVYFNGTSATVNLESASKIILDGGQFLATDTINLFDGAGTVTITDKGTSIIAGNGMLDGQMNEDGTISFTLSKTAANYLYAQSNPVKDLTLDVIGNEDGDYSLEDAGVSYIAAISALNGGAAVEETARLAVYGGAVQATYLAQQTSTDAVADRLNTANPNSSLISANNQNGGGLWLAPVYKNHDSDGFDAQGIDYGADIDLYGAALGADFTTASGVRVGAYFNLGSGDADGQGVGSDVTNDFDYFGMGMYAGVKYGALSFMADAGFTQVSNDLEQNINYNSLGKASASTDTTAVTLGLRGEYKLETAMMDITPHVGMRYTNLSMDDYDAKIDGYPVATTNADSMDIFSIPFGVTLSADYELGGWTLQPVFDVTLTANAGDTDIDTSTTFIGAQSLNLSTEVLDSFTYGATLGLGAKFSDSFSVGIGVNYTGSSNADEYGVTANTRFVF